MGTTVKGKIALIPAFPEAAATVSASIEAFCYHHPYSKTACSQWEEKSYSSLDCMVFHWNCHCHCLSFVKTLRHNSAHGWVPAGVGKAEAVTSDKQSKEEERAHDFLRGLRYLFHINTEPCSSPHSVLFLAPERRLVFSIKIFFFLFNSQNSSCAMC